MNARSALRAAAIAFSLALARGPAVAQTPSPAAVAPQPSASVPGANEIYDRARAAAKARTLPPYLSYDTHATFERKGKIKAEHLRVVLRTADGKSYVTPVPDSPRDRIDTAPRVEDRPPYNLSPFNTFGLIERSRARSPRSMTRPGRLPPRRANRRSSEA
jgi:hypothetical protein